MPAPFQVRHQGQQGRDSRDAGPRRQSGRSDLDRDPAAAERPMGGCGRDVPQNPRGRARLSRRGALLGRARPSGRAERAGCRADRAESRARARSGGLAQQSGDRPAGSAQAGRGDRRLSARDCSSIRITPTRTTISGSLLRAQGRLGRSGSGLSRRHSRKSRALGRVHQPGHPAERPEADAAKRPSASARSSRSGRSTPKPDRLLALAHCTLGEVDEAVAIFEEWLAGGAGPSHCPAT